MKKLIALALAGALALSMSGCSQTADQRASGSNVTAKYVSLPDGGRVLCVFWVNPASNSTSQMSCNWGGR